ncbi:MAG TPA: RNA 2',3'-cyclic phosphodiesterase [Acidimicrobiales bacterium]|jgi:2'-5' RNA ligase|nr:RNA 2',3'-cyclic phosphodiesterase [Acidimicrobiales bacterium]
MFVAVWPNESTRERLSGLDLGFVPGLRVVGPEEWHITLRFLGEVDDGQLTALVIALGSAAASMSGAFRCRLGPSTAWFSGDRVLQIPAEGLDDLAAGVRSRTLEVVPEGIDRPPPFQGHLTLARSKGRRVDASGRGRAALAGIPFEAAFDIGSFDLVGSERSLAGPRYTTLAKVTLPE